MTDGQIDEQRRQLLPSAFHRLILNEPDVVDEDRLTNYDDLRASVDEGRTVLEPEPDWRYVVTVDLGLRRDRTVVCVAHRERDDEGSYTVVDRLRTWVPSPGHEVDLSDVEATVLAAARQYNAPVMLDPSQAALLAQRLKAERVKVNEFTFSASSVGRLAFGLFSALQNRRLSLPDDPDLIDELLQVRLRTNSAGTVRLDHPSGGNDDRAATIALAIHALSELPGRHRRGVRAANDLPRDRLRAVPEGLNKRDAARWAGYHGGPDAA
jgi:hypothetical protein